MTPMQAFNYIYDLVNRVKKIRSWLNGWYKYIKQWFN
jgi:hypothetical protein